MEIFYTVVDADDHSECQVYIGIPSEVGENVTIRFGSLPPRKIDSQQLAELGHLLVALSGHDYDDESVRELIEGYEIGLVPGI